MSQRIIAHLDMDAFFASIEERDHPRLAGKPIVVGADPLGGRGRGVVSTANYPARAYGIRSALPITRAWQFSEDARRRGLPAAVFMAVDMEKYATVSHDVMTIVREVIAARTKGGKPPVIAQASVDEAYIDLSFCSSYKEAAALAREIKDTIRREARLTASVGIGPNKLIAKIASDFQKPDGLTVVQGEEEAAAFIAPMSIRAIPGVGPKTEAEFKALGIRTIAEARRYSLAALREMMGKSGGDLYEKLRGRSDSPVYEDAAMKSVSEQTTFAHDVGVKTVKDRKVLTDALAAIASNVAERLIIEGGDGTDLDGFTTFRSVGIVVRFSDFTTKTRVVTLPKPVQIESKAAIETLKFQSLRLFMPFMDRRENPEHKSIRLLGVKAERLQ